MNTKTTKRSVLLAMGLIGASVLFIATAGPVLADPPRHAPANGWRRNDDRRDNNRRDNDNRWDNRRNDRDNRRDNDRWDNRRNDRGGSWDRDHDGIPNYRDRWDNSRDSWRRVDSDRDGVPNYRDRRPYDRRRH